MSNEKKLSIKENAKLELIQDLEWNINYHKRKMEEYELRLEIVKCSNV